MRGISPTGTSQAESINLYSEWPLACWFARPQCRNAAMPKWMAGFTMVGAAIAAAAMLLVLNRCGGWPSAANWKILWPTVEGSVWAALVVGYVSVGDVLPRVLAWQVARTGEMSFSSYLLHFAVIEATAMRHGRLARPTGAAQIDALFWTGVVVLPVTLACSALTYRVIELPFLRRRSKYLVPVQSSPTT
jgi:peptidoglycan/LPS O-acetylase OafA/YrhL